MNKAQKYFWTFWGYMGLSTIIAFINPIVGLCMFIVPLIGLAIGLMIWVLRDMYKELGD